MRVISGEARGRKLEAPAGLAVRPTADRVRQTIFDLLAFRWQGGRALDLFAGSGALGIEALSRGADFVVFGEKNTEALACVNRNVQACGFESRASVRRGDYRTVLAQLTAAGERFGLVFIDPPYEGPARDESIAGVAPLLAPGAFIVVETASTEAAPVAQPGWVLEKEKKFGRTLIFLYRYEQDRDLSR